jgi:hypothetical protein
MSTADEIADFLAVKASRDASDAWADPDRALLGDGLAAAPTLPLDAFGRWSGWVSTFAAAGCAPADYAAAGLLSAASAAVGAARKVSPWDGWAEYPALWCLMVGPPSASKSPVYGPMSDALRDLERAEGANHDDRRRQWETERLVAKLKREQWERDTEAAEKERRPAPHKPADADEPDEPKPPRIVTSDATVESLTPLFAANLRGLLLARDELSGWVGNFGKYGGDGDAAYFLERFTGAPASVDRVKAGHVRADRALLSVFGGIQPERLGELLLNRPDDGLVSRFLMFYPNPVPRRRPAEAARLDLLADALRRLRGLAFAQDEDGHDVPRILRLTPAAAATFEAWWGENGAAASDSQGFEAGALGKGPGLVLRLALVLELLDWSAQPGAPEPAEVGDAAVMWAAALFDDYFVPMAARAIGVAALPKAEREAATLLRQLRKAGKRSVNARDLRRGPEGRASRLTDAGAMTDALGRLAEAGWTRFAGGREGDGGGRQRGDWEVNPKLWS